MIGRKYPKILTRPNDVVAYSRGDVIGFTEAEKTSRIGIPEEIRPSAGSSQMIRCRFFEPVSVIGPILVAFDAIQPAKIELEFWAFSQELKIQEDNTPFAPTLKDLISLMAIIQFDEYAAAGKRVYQSRPASVVIPTVRDLWGVLVVKTPFTPTANGEFLISLAGQIDGIARM